MTARAPPRPRAVEVVPSIGSTAMSALGGVPSPIRSPLKSMGALSFSPSPMTTTPSMAMLERTIRIALDRCAVGPLLVPPPHPPGRGQGRCLGDPDKLHGQIAVGCLDGRAHGHRR